MSLGRSRPRSGSQLVYVYHEVTNQESNGLQTVFLRASLSLTHILSLSKGSSCFIYLIRRGSTTLKKKKV